MRVEAREDISVILKFSAPIIAAIVAMFLCGLLIWWTGASPIKAFSLLFTGALGSTFAISETLTRATPLIFTGLAAAIAFRAKHWNIGAEGQLYLGACLGNRSL